MTFTDYYQTIYDKKRKDFVRRTIINVIGISYGTFRRWANGEIIPNKCYQTKIAEIMGVEVSELFPNTNNNSEVTIKNAK